MNIEFGDEVDGTMPMLQVNLESSDPPPLLLPFQVTWIGLPFFDGVRLI